MLVAPVFVTITIVGLNIGIVIIIMSIMSIAIVTGIDTIDVATDMVIVMDMIVDTTTIMEMDIKLLFVDYGTQRLVEFS